MTHSICTLELLGERFPGITVSSQSDICPCFSDSDERRCCVRLVISQSSLSYNALIIFVIKPHLDVLNGPCGALFMLLSGGQMGGLATVYLSWIESMELKHNQHTLFESSYLVFPICLPTRQGIMAPAKEQRFR